MSIFSAACSVLSGSQYGWAFRHGWRQLVELFEEEKKLKIEMLRTGWNFQITRLTTRALRKNKNKKNFLCDLFYLFFADFFVFDITWTFKEWGQSNFAVKWGLTSRFRRHITRRPSFRNFLIRRLWSLVKNQKWIFLSKLIRHCVKSGGGYENGVGGRVVQLFEIRVECWQWFEQFAGKKSESGGYSRWNLRKWMESIVDAMFSNSVILRC